MKYVTNSVIEREHSRNRKSKYLLRLASKEMPKAALIILSSFKVPTNHQLPFSNQNSVRDQAPQTTVTTGFKSNRPTNAGSQRGQVYSQPYRGGCFLCGRQHIARTCSDHGASAEARGRSFNKSRSAQVTATPTSVVYTEEELVKMLSECQLKKEEEALLAQDGS